MTKTTFRLPVIPYINPATILSQNPHLFFSKVCSLSSSINAKLPFSLCISLFLSLYIFLSLSSGLANIQETLEETRNKRVVLALYEALRSRDVDLVQKLLTSDLEWWFHGPPSHQFLMRILTGTVSPSPADCSFQFDPLTVDAIGPTVFVEGEDISRNITWVHAWTVTDGIITQVREYFNTSLTVTRLGNQSRSASASAAATITPLHCPSVWESSLSNRVGKSVPGLVLAI